MATLAPAITAGHRNPRRLTEHVQALINWSTELPDGGEKLRVLEQAERIATDVVQMLENTELDHLLARALFSRGRAREQLERSAEATDDYERAATLAPTNPNVVIRAVRLRQSAGDTAAALGLLPDPIVESSIVLRLLRAELRANGADQDSAYADARHALDELASAATRGTMQFYLNVADLALGLDHPELAERALASIRAGSLMDAGPDPRVLAARLAVARDDWAGAEMEYRTAAALAGIDDSRRILGEFATRLSAAGRFDQAISVYEDIGADDPQHALFGNVVASLMYSGRFDRVLQLTSELESEAERRGELVTALPQALLDAAIDIAWRREDFATAARLLEARLVQNDGSARAPSPGLFLATAQAQVNVGNHARAEVLVDRVLARADLVPEDRMRAAGVLVAVGQHQRAVDTAFIAIRACPTEKEMIASFIQVVLAPALDRPRSPSASPAIDASATSAMGSVDADAVDITDADEDDEDEGDDIGTDGREGTVAANTFVRVRTDDGQRYDYFIYADPPVDSRLSEYLVSDPAVADLVGKHVGDAVVRNRGTWNEQRLRVARVMPAVVVVFRRYMRTFAAQFPEQPMFRTFNVGKSPTLESLAPILASAHASSAHADEVLAKYDGAPLPLGLVAKALGKSLADVAVALASDPSRRIHVDAPPYTTYGSAVDAAINTSAVVLTRPSLVFLDSLGLWDAITARYRLIAPHSMMEEWREELRKLQALTDHGQIGLREVGGRPTIDEIPVGAADTALQTSRALYDRVQAVSTVLHRPATALRTEDDDLRALIGASSFDAVALAQSEGAALYADDLGLRVIADAKYSVRSFPTAALLEALHGNGSVNDDQFEVSTIRLIEWGHEIVPVRATTIAAAFGRGATSMRTGDRVLQTLADARVTPLSAAIVAVGALRALAMADIATCPLTSVAERTVAALTAARSAQDVLPPFIVLLHDAFRLLPRECDVIETIVRRVLMDERIVNANRHI